MNGTTRIDIYERITWTATLLITLLFVYCIPVEFLTADICPFMRIFHIPCPLCGISRSIYHTARGNFTLAFSFHPGGIFLFFTLISVFPVLLSSTLYSRFRAFNATTGFLRYCTAVTVMSVALLWIVRTVRSFL